MLQHFPPKKISPFFSALILCLVINLPAFATKPYFPKQVDPITIASNWRAFPELKGLGLRCLTEAPDKTMWFGIDKGLLHYDGIHWTSVPFTEDQTPIAVDVLLTTNRGTMYAGTGIDIRKCDGKTWQRHLDRSGPARHAR